MPKNKVQQRVRQKRQAEKVQRRKAARMRKVYSVAAVIAGAAVVVAAVFGIKSLVGGKSEAKTVSPGTTSAAGCPNGAVTSKPAYKAAPKMTIDKTKTYTAAIKTSLGTITAALDAKRAPITVNSFAFLAKNHFFDCTIFHRVIDGFMIQGGDPEGTGRGGPGYQFKNETSKSDSFDKPGILAMANAGPDTNGSQFFVTVAPYPSLNGGYTIFGHVLAGQDVADKISKLPRNQQDRPNTPPLILGVTITES